MIQAPQNSHYQNHQHLSVSNTFCPSQLKDDEQYCTRSGSQIIEVVNNNQRAKSAVIVIQNNLEQPRAKSDVLHYYKDPNEKQTFKKKKSILYFERVIDSIKNNDGSHQNFQQNSSSSQKSNLEFKLTDIKRYNPINILSPVKLDNWPELIYFKKVYPNFDLIGFEFQSNQNFENLEMNLVDQFKTHFKHNKMFLPLKFVDQKKQFPAEKMIYYQKKGKFLYHLTPYEQNLFVTTLGKQIISVFKNLDNLDIQKISFSFLDLKHLLYDPKHNQIYFFDYLKIKESNVSFLKGALNLLNELKTFLEAFNSKMKELNKEDNNDTRDKMNPDSMNKSHSKISSNILNRSVVLENLKIFIEEMKKIKDFNFGIFNSIKPNVDDSQTVLKFRHIILQTLCNQDSIKHMDFTRDMIETPRVTPKSHQKIRNIKSEVSQCSLDLRNSLPSTLPDRNIA